MNNEMQLNHRRSGAKLNRQSFVGLAFAAVFCLQVFCPQASASEPFEMKMHDADIYGSRDVEAGNYSQGIQKLESLLARGSMASSRKIAVLSDLCVAYTMVRELEKASEVCDQAVAIGWSSGLALNNRGVFNIARGDYQAAIADFQEATGERGGGLIASRNLDRATDRVLAMQAQEMPVMANVSDPANSQ